MTNKFEVVAVQRLGEQIGYGHLMWLASALWRRSLVKKYGEGHEIGAFIPTLRSLVVDEWVENVDKEIKLYDGIIRTAYGEEI